MAGVASFLEVGSVTCSPKMGGARDVLHAYGRWDPRARRGRSRSRNHGFSHSPQLSGKNPERNASPPVTPPGAAGEAEAHGKPKREAKAQAPSGNRSAANAMWNLERDESGTKDENETKLGNSISRQSYVMLGPRYP